MYSGIIKIYYRKAVRHLFTKPVQIEGKTQFFSPSKLFFIVVHISAARRCEYIMRKWPLRGRSRFVCCNITRGSLWLLCNVHFVHSIRPNIATWPRWPKVTDHCSSEECRCTHVDVCGKNLNIISMCAVSPAVHTSNISICQKNICPVFLWLWTIPLTYVLWVSCYKCL